MAKRNRQMLGRLAIALAIVVAALPFPAGAQFFGSNNNYYGQRPNRPPPSRGFFSFPLFGNPGGGDQYNPFYRPAPPPVESFKAPPPRKLDTPPASTVMVIGDTMADWLAYGLEDVLSDSPDVGVVRNIRPTSGLVRYDAKNDSLEWSGVIKDALVNEKPSAIVVMLGLNDRLPFRDKVPPKPAPPSAQAAPQPQGQSQNQDKTAPPDAAKPDGEQPAIAASEPVHQGPPGSYDFHTDKWAELYAKRVDEMIAALKSKGVPVLWVGLPAVYGTKSTSDMSYFDEIFRARAERAGIVYVDIWDGFVDESGRYVTQGPDFEGQIRRLRTGDGVHFTKYGAVKLAQYVVQDLRRVMANHVVPVALPAPEGGTPAKPGAGPRPAVGPVLPLTADTSVDGNNLLGDGGRTTPANADPMAVRVLTHGDPIPAPSGRADDFSWPRPGGNANAEAAPEPAAVAPPAPPPKGAPANPKKTDDIKPDTKTKVAPAAPARRPSASLDGGPPRPPAPVGGF
ncbi:MAG TPA: SGNH family hydrolase [Xanthobacteraceae bacterium]|nr:SGNH family hydrolase [Xanthobacteraceae bacterium]